MHQDSKELSEFVKLHPRGNVFQTIEMYEVYKKTKNYEPVLITLKDESELVGVLLAVIQKENSGILGTFSARSIIWGGPLVKNNDPLILDRILKEYVSKAKGKVIYSQFRNFWEWTEVEKRVFEKNEFSYEAHLNILVNLKKDEDTLWKNIDAKGRNKIKGAIKAGVSFTIKNDIPSLTECYQVLSSVYKRTKLPIPSFDFFLNLHSSFSKTNGFKMFVVQYEEKIIGCMLALVYKDSIYDFYAGSYMDHYNKHPNDLVPWEVFKWGKSEGYSSFDFGGAGKPNETYGVRDYKKKFGGDTVEFGRYVSVHKAGLMKLGKFLMKIYKLVK